MRTYKLIPESMRQITYDKWGEWHVSQKFLYLGKYPRTIRGWGLERLDAIRVFEIELWYAEHAPYRQDMLQRICGWIWDIAGLIDKFLASIKALLILL